MIDILLLNLHLLLMDQTNGAVELQIIDVNHGMVGLKNNTSMVKTLEDYIHIFRLQ